MAGLKDSEVRKKFAEMDRTDFYNTLDESSNTFAYFKVLESLLNENGMDWSQVENMIDTLVSVGYLSENEAGLHNNKWKEMLGAYRDENFADEVWNWMQLSSTDRSLNRIMDGLIKYISGEYFDFNAMDDLFNTVGSSGPAQISTPAPDYISYLLEGEKDVDIHRAHLMNAEEMADLYSLNIDPQSYYDMVKQSTEAGVTYQDFLDAQAGNAQRYNDLQNNASYLDSIRNSKSEAIANGASKGAMAAQQILEAVNDNSTYSNAYNESVQNRGDAYQDAYYANAHAQQTADAIYGSLMNNVMQNSLGQYASDVSRYGSDVAAKALMYGANVNSLANRYAMNSDMYSAYVQSLANSNLAYSQAGGQANELASLWNIFKTAYNGDLRMATAAFQPIITGAYANSNKYGSIRDYYSAVKDK